MFCYRNLLEFNTNKEKQFRYVFMGKVFFKLRSLKDFKKFINQLLAEQYCNAFVYYRFSQTGKARKGDSSSAIYSGTIDQDRVDYSHIPVPDDVLHRAREVYRRCREGIIAGSADAIIMPGGTPSR